MKEINLINNFIYKTLLMELKELNKIFNFIN